VNFLIGNNACANNSQIRAIAFVYSFPRNKDAEVHCGAAYINYCSCKVRM
jgi:hypothetical protein